MDAGHRAEDVDGKVKLDQKKATPMGPEHNECAHRIQTRVARSKGDSAQFFRKLAGPPEPTRIRPTGWNSTLPGGRGRPSKALRC